MQGIIDPSKLRCGYQRVILKIIWKDKRPRISNTVLMKNKVGGLPLPNYKTYYKATVIMTVWHWLKNIEIN